jgi:dipeptidyl aminopeptidase/acylaminoacyl peptidase
MMLTKIALLAAAFLLGSTLAARGDEPARRQIGQMVLEGVPEVNDAIRQRMAQYLEVRRATLSSISDDGASVLVATRFGQTSQLHLVAAPLGMRRQITFYDEPVSSGGFVPGSAGRKILFSKDVGGNENFQVNLLDLDSGRARLLTDGKSRHEGGTLSNNGKLLAISNNARNSRDMDVYMIDVAGAAPPRLAWQVEGSYTPVAFSPDDSKLLVLHYISERETRYHVMDIASGGHVQITPAEPPAYYGGGAWSSDGQSVYLTSDREGEFRKLYQLKMGYGEWRCLTGEIEWDVDDVAVENASGGLAFSVNEDGLSKLYFADSWGNGRKPVAGIPTGVIGGLTFAKKAAVLGFSLDAATSPADVYTVSYPGGALTRWTESEVGGLDPKTFVEPKLVRFPTFDQLDGKPRQIPAFHFKGKGEGKRPVLIMAHGGPEAQYQPTFSSLVQYFAVEMGISVICPNPRGSTGYGRSFHQLDNGVLREDSVKDIGALLDWIEKQPDLDATRVGIYGGSYGGYVVLASLANYPKRFRMGIDVVGIADFVSFLERTSEYRRDLRRAEYGDERVPEVRAVLEKIAPLRNAEKIEAALFVAHGKNDPRVPLNEAEQIVAKMRELKRPVWFANALDEGHGFQKKQNRDLVSVLYALFAQEHLLK